MIDDREFIEELADLLINKELPMVEYVELSAEEVITCAGIIMATTKSWGVKRDIVADLLLRLDNSSVNKVMMFLDEDTIKNTMPKC